MDILYNQLQYPDFFSVLILNEAFQLSSQGRQDPFVALVNHA
jgi:hypothetical protein